MEDARHQRREDPAADGQEGGAGLVAPTDKGQLCRVGGIVHVVRANEDDVERRTGGEGVGRVEGDAGAQLAGRAGTGLGDPVVLDGEGLGSESGGDGHHGGGDGGDEGLVEGAEEVERGDVEDLGGAMFKVKGGC